MSRSPRATPSAPMPKTGLVPVEQRRLSSVLCAPVVVVTPEGERELVSGSLRIGRHPSSDIVLNDALVSRTHARLVIEDDHGIVVEDLHSANGVYVNGERLGRHALRLREGDRLLIGTCELSVFATRRSEAHEPVASARPETRVLGPESEGQPTTERTDALHMVARLAERLHRSGNSPEAIRVLSGHLNKVLLGASAGLPVPDDLLDQASRHAVELYYWTHNGAWIDYVVELHLAAQQLPSERTVAALEAATAAATGTPFDANLLKYYLESQANEAAPRSLGEAARLSRLERLRQR
ncbi:MAG: FHA domain-containing protein [Polyangiaceae bacterium]